MAQFRSAALLRGHVVRWFVPSDAGTRLVEPPALRPDHRKEADDGDRELIVLDKGRIGGGFAKSINALTSREQKENILPSVHREFCHVRIHCLPDIATMSGLRPGDRDVRWNLRSTIKALIMANEYLEAELRGTAGGGPRLRARSAAPEQRRRLIDRTGAQQRSKHGRCHLLCRTAVPSGRCRFAGRRRGGGMPELVCCAAARRDSVESRRAASARSPSAAPAIP